MVMVIIMLQLLCGSVIFASDKDNGEDRKASYDSSQEMNDLIRILASDRDPQTLSQTTKNVVSVENPLNIAVVRSRLHCPSPQRANSSAGNSEIIPTIDVAIQVPSPLDNEKEKSESEVTGNCCGCFKGIFDRFMKKTDQ